MDEVHAWHEQDFYFVIFDCAYNYDHQVGSASVVQVIFWDRQQNYYEASLASHTSAFVFNSTIQHLL